MGPKAGFFSEALQLAPYPFPLGWDNGCTSLRHWLKGLRSPTLGRSASKSARVAMQDTEYQQKYWKKWLTHGRTYRELCFEAHRWLDDHDQGLNATPMNPYI